MQSRVDVEETGIDPNPKIQNPNPKFRGLASADELSIQLVNALRATGYLTEQGDLVIQESRELVKIVATIIRNSEARDVHRR
jgi:hypothetical protein